MLAVLVYHAAPAWLPGGYLGVEVFFVISGYLITALLLAEWRQRNRIDLGRFWLRRARRLLPALYLVIFATLLVTTLVLPDEVVRLRGDALAALGYVTNWYLIFGHQSYFVSMGRPSLLQHLWSLAVEEQFYLIWPLLLLAMLRWCRRLVTPLILAGALASAGWMALLYRPGVDASRLYYGTDSRAAGLLIGAALATLWSMERQEGVFGRRRSLMFDAACVGGLAALAVLCARLGEFQPFLYRGGFLLVDLATIVVIAATVHPAGYAGKQLLGCGLLRWLGERSYGIYLWHWPVFMLTRQRLDVPIEGPLLLGLRLLATIALAELSFRLVEMPVRRGVLARAWRAMRAMVATENGPAYLRWVAGIGLFLGFTAVMGMEVVVARPAATPSSPVSVSIRRSPAAAPPALSPDATAVVPAAADGAAPDAADAAIPVRPASHVLEQTVSAVGDSVMLGSTQALLDAMPHLDIDAEVGRQPAAALTVVKAMRASGELGDTVVLHLGNNGPFTARELDDLLQAIGNDRRVLLVNLRVPRAWEEPNNEVIAGGVKRHSNVLLIDWHSVSAGHAEYFRDDGVHLLPAGALVYVGMIGVRLYTDEMVRLLTGKMSTFGVAAP